MRFQQITPKDLTEQIKAWLEVSVNKTPSADFTLSDIIERAQRGEGAFYLVSNEVPIGAFYIEWLPWCLNVVLIGGDYIKDWSVEMHDFCIALIREKNIKTICFIGRYGIGKIFPRMKPIGMLFQYDDGG